MEDKQMREYTFFSKIGAFSINLEDPKSSIRSLRYAVESMERKNSCLFIYPEGKITPLSDSPPYFKKGLSWLYTETQDVDFVPIHIYAHFIRSSKPELYISIGESVNHDKSLDRNKLTELFEADIYQLNHQTRAVAGISDEGFDPQF